MLISLSWSLPYICVCVCTKTNHHGLQTCTDKNNQKNSTKCNLLNINTLEDRKHVSSSFHFLLYGLTQGHNVISSFSNGLCFVMAKFEGMVPVVWWLLVTLVVLLGGIHALPMLGPCNLKHQSVALYEVEHFLGFMWDLPGLCLENRVVSRLNYGTLFQKCHFLLLSNGHSKYARLTKCYQDVLPNIDLCVNVSEWYVINFYCPYINACFESA